MQPPVRPSVVDVNPNVGDQQPPHHFHLREDPPASQQAAPPQASIQGNGEAGLNLITQLTNIYCYYSNLEDDLSVKIQNVARKYILGDYTQVTQATQLTNIVTNLKRELEAVLTNDFDNAVLVDPVILGNWKFEKWQLLDYIKLEKYFIRRGHLPRTQPGAALLPIEVASIDPKDSRTFPAPGPNQAFVVDIIQLLRTIPDTLLESNRVPARRTMAHQDVEENPSEANELVAWRRYSAWKKLVENSIRKKMIRNRLEQTRNDVAAQRLVARNLFEQGLRAEEQGLRAHFDEQEQRINSILQEFEESRNQIRTLDAQLQAAISTLAALRRDLAVQVQFAAELQRQIDIEQAKYNALVQQIQELSNRCKKKHHCVAF